MMILVSPEITLEALQKEDADELFMLIENNREYLKKWLPWLDQSNSLRDTSGFIEKSTPGKYNLKSLVLGVFFNHRLVGVVSFNVINPANREGSLGYWISKDYQGQGIITKSMKSLIAYGFENLNLKTVTISCAEKNIKSISVAKNLGFHLVNKVNDKEWLYNRHVSHYIFALHSHETLTL